MLADHKVSPSAALTGMMLVFLLTIDGRAAGEPLRLKGITMPIKDAALSAVVPGTVSRILVKEGDVVTEGNVILELDKAQETLETQRRKLIWTDQSEFHAASNRVDTLRRDLASTRKLFETTKSVSADELDRKELEFKLASAELGRLRASESREAIEYRMAEEQLRRRDLTAPMPGTITRIDTEVGEYCEPRQPLVRLVDTSRFYFVGNVTETLGQRLRLGQPVVLQAGEGQAAIQVTGKLCFVSPTVDPASGLLEVKAEFDNPEGRVRPGTAAELLIEVLPHGE